MIGRNLLLDSNIIIYLSKGVIDTETLFAEHDKFYISIITYMEVLGFRFSDQEEIKIIKELLGYFTLVNINMEIANTVVAIKQEKKIKLPDAIILATAKFSKSDLMTRNVKDFKNIYGDINIINPFDR